jgi:RNA polymerase sigma-70 factor (ECF subfamily)
MRRPEVELPADLDQESGLVASESEDPLAQVTTGEGVDRLGECLKRLPREQRLAVLMAYYQGYTHGEMARALGAPLGTVKSWVRRGLQHLRECMKT